VTFWFRALGILTALGIPLYAWVVRGRVYGIFAAVILAIAFAEAIGIYALVVAILIGFVF